VPVGRTCSLLASIESFLLVDHKQEKYNGAVPAACSRANGDCDNEYARAAQTFGGIYRQRIEAATEVVLSATPP